MGKFRDEPFITQRKGKTGLWTFQVYLRTEKGTITKSFSERKYLSARAAFESAVAYKNKVLTEIANNTYLQNYTYTVEDMFNIWLETTTASYKTKDYHEKLFNKYISHQKTFIQKLSRADIQEDLNKMVDIASDDTIGRVLSIYRTDIVETALIKEYINKDITLGVKKPVSHYITKSKDVTTDRATINKVKELILEKMQNKYNAKIITLLIDVLYFTGMRPAEAEVLTKDDIKDGFIVINKELGSSTEKMNVIRRCKTPSSVRKIPISANLRVILNELLLFSKHNILFAKEDGSYMNSTWIGDKIRYICVPENIEFNLYRLRHNMATELVTNNVDSRTTMEILGHSHYDMSLYYASSSDELKSEALTLVH